MNKINFLSVFQENLYGETERRTGQTDIQKNRPYFIGPFWPCPGVQEKPQSLN